MIVLEKRAADKKTQIKIAQLKKAEATAEEEAEAKLPLLSEEQQAYCKSVRKMGLGACGRCRWTSGCDLCSFPHAVRFWLRKGPDAVMTQKQKKVIVYGL